MVRRAGNVNVATVMSKLFSSSIQSFSGFWTSTHSSQWPPKKLQILQPREPRKLTTASPADSAASTVMRTSFSTVSRNQPLPSTWILNVTVWPSVPLTLPLAVIEKRSTPANFALNDPVMLNAKFVPSNEAWIVPLPLMPVLSQPSTMLPVNVRSKCPFDWMFP